jgi:hypothetical protein
VKHIRNKHAEKLEAARLEVGAAGGARGRGLAQRSRAPRLSGRGWGLISLPCPPHNVSPSHRQPSIANRLNAPAANATSTPPRPADPRPQILDEIAHLQFREIRGAELRREQQERTGARARGGGADGGPGAAGEWPGGPYGGPGWVGPPGGFPGGPRPPIPIIPPGVMMGGAPMIIPITGMGPMGMGPIVPIGGGVLPGGIVPLGGMDHGGRGGFGGGGRGGGRGERGGGGGRGGGRGRGGPQREYFDLDDPRNFKGALIDYGDI